MLVRMSDAEAGPDIDGGGSGTSPMCFLHVPKAAGSSIHAALEAALPLGSLAPQHFDRSLFCDFNDFDLLSPGARCQVVANPGEIQLLSGYRAVSGHFSLTTLLQIADALSIATVLREPRARLLSLYTYWRVPDIGDFWAPYSATEYAQRPLAAFLSESRLAPAVDNQMCRMLLYGDPRLPESGFADQSDVQAIAADAIALLDELGFVGVIELGDSAWQGVARLFGVTLDPIKVNVTGELVSLAAIRPGEALFTANALDLLERRNAADMLVYDHALTRAGVDARERRRLSDGAFAHQLVKLGDLIGHSAAHTAVLAGTVESLRGELDERERSHAQLDEVCDRVDAHERTIQGLNDEIRRRDEDLDKLRRWLAAVHASASWRVTAPLRAAKHGIQSLQPSGRVPAVRTSDRSLMAWWSVNQVWGIALALCAIIAVTDAILTHIVLIALLAAGPFCGLLTGRWTRTATVGIWAVALAVLLGFPDEIWDTHTQFVDLGAVATVAFLSTVAAMFVERRRYQQIR
jgi:hypothetical protein